MKDDKIIISLSALNVLTIVGALLSLNRLNNVPFNFEGRILIEHAITGLYGPAILLFFVIIIHKGIKLILGARKESEATNYNSTLILLTLIVFGFELWWQFSVSVNNDSFYQMIYLLIGVVLLWTYIIKMKLFER